MKFSFKILPGLFLLVLLISSCGKDRFLTDPGATLAFSTDTLRFDTVFTARGSATRLIKVFNRYAQPIRIAHIRIAGGTASSFRINVDGLPGEGRDIEIAPEDSLYVFAEVTVDPDLPLSQSPFVITDSLLFTLNGREQRVVLEAWGQNANYIPNRYAQGQQALLTCQLGEVVWDDPKPYVIYGVLLVDSCTLTIPAGTRVYVHGGIARIPGTGFYSDGILYMLQHGRLQVQGSADLPVVIQGDRLEPAFQELHGQWSGIRFGKGSSGPHKIEHAIIKNAIVALYADSASSVELRSVSITNSSSSGILGVRARIQAVNCLLANNLGGGATMLYGGDYSYTYCTMANVGLSRDVLLAQNYICYDPPFCTEGDIFPIRLQVTNSILSNGGKDVLNLLDGVPADPTYFQYAFDHTLLRVEDLLKQQRFADFMSRCNGCVTHTRDTTLFLDPGKSDYTLDTMSVARGIARSLPGVQVDLRDLPRKSIPDAGCYEFQE